MAKASWSALHPYLPCTPGVEMSILYILGDGHPSGFGSQTVLLTLQQLTVYWRTAELA